VESELIEQVENIGKGNGPKDPRYKRVAWYFKLLAIAFFLIPSLTAYYLGFRQGENVLRPENLIVRNDTLRQNEPASTEMLPKPENIVIKTDAVKQNESATVWSKPSWKLFSGRNFPFQVQYPEKWSLYVMSSGFFKDSRDIELSSGSKRINIGTRGNPDRLLVKEWWESSLKTLEFQPPEPTTYVYELYMTVNGIEIFRCFAYRSGQMQSNGIFLIFTVDNEGFYAIGNSAVIESDATEKELSDIMETFTVGKAAGKDIPPYVPPEQADTTL